MKWQVFLVFSFMVCSYKGFSMTIGDVTTATGIQNTLSGVATSSPQGAVDKAKEVVKISQEREQKNKEKLDSLKDYPDTPFKPSNFEPKDLDNPPPPYLEDLSRKELDERFDDGGIDINADKVDYTKNTVIFYKDNCSKSGRNLSQSCESIPVLTNIKSVIFNYAHKRGEFKEKY